MRAHTVTRATIMATCVFAALAGCAGNGEGLDQNGRPPTSMSPGTALQPNLNSIQENVFTPVCTRCHAGATAPRGLRLEAGVSYSMLVGVASGQVPALQRVRPGDPAASYLIQKLTGTAAVGQRMPLGGPFLPQSTIDVISQWILLGAPRPTSVSAPEKPNSDGLQVVATFPMSDAQLSEPVTQLIVGFDRELDANLVNASTVMLTLDGASMAATLRVPLANPHALLITPRTPLGAGNYRLTLRGSGGGALAGLDARPLLASQGAGRDFSIDFSVAAQ